jgi:hypothetical protein
MDRRLYILKKIFQIRGALLYSAKRRRAGYLAIQAKYGTEGPAVPLVIMVSNDTHYATAKLLEAVLRSATQSSQYEA